MRTNEIIVHAVFVLFTAFLLGIVVTGAVNWNLFKGERWSILLVNQAVLMFGFVAVLWRANVLWARVNPNAWLPGFPFKDGPLAEIQAVKSIAPWRRAARWFWWAIVANMALFAILL